MMKKIVLFAVMFALCFPLGGCLSIQSNASSEIEATEVSATVDTEDQPAAGESEEFTDEGFTDEELPEDAEYDLADLGIEEFDIPRTLKPATAAQQKGVIHVDYSVENELFATQMDEIQYYPEDFTGKNLQLEGYILYYEDGPNDTTQFAIVRDFQLPPHEHAEGEIVDHEHEEESYAIGFDCAYNGTIPAENSWASVVGTVVEYDYIDPDSGEVFPSLYLKILSLEILPEPSGARTVTQ